MIMMIYKSSDTINKYCIILIRLLDHDVDACTHIVDMPVVNVSRA